MIKKQSEIVTGLSTEPEVFDFQNYHYEINETGRAWFVTEDSETGETIREERTAADLEDRISDAQAYIDQGVDVEFFRREVAEYSAVLDQIA